MHTLQLYQFKTVDLAEPTRLLYNSPRHQFPQTISTSIGFDGLLSFAHGTFEVNGVTFELSHSDSSFDSKVNVLWLRLPFHSMVLHNVSTFTIHLHGCGRTAGWPDKAPVLNISCADTPREYKSHTVQGRKQVWIKSPDIFETLNDNFVCFDKDGNDVALHRVSHHLYRVCYQEQEELTVEYLSDVTLRDDGTCNACVRTYI